MEGVVGEVGCAGGGRGGEGLGKCIKLPYDQLLSPREASLPTLSQLRLPLPPLPFPYSLHSLPTSSPKLLPPQASIYVSFPPLSHIYFPFTFLFLFPTSFLVILSFCVIQYLAHLNVITPFLLPFLFCPFYIPFLLCFVFLYLLFLPSLLPFIFAIPRPQYISSLSSVLSLLCFHISFSALFTFLASSLVTFLPSLLSSLQPFSWSSVPYITPHSFPFL